MKSGSIKEQDGAAMSLGSVSNFIDVYIESDLHDGILDEAGAQELITPRSSANIIWPNSWTKTAKPKVMTTAMKPWR